MTSKERMLVAMTGGQPDMVPVAPDLSNMIPARLTGKPFWDIYLYNDPPLWKAYLQAVRHFGFDGWMVHGQIGPSPADKRRYRQEIREQRPDRIVVRTYCETPAGELWEETVYYVDNPPTTTRKYIKDLERDFEHLQYFFPDPCGCSAAPLEEQKRMMGDSGVVGVYVGYPALMWFLRDGAENPFLDYYDHYDLVKQYAEMADEYAVRLTRRLLEIKPDYIFTGWSGTLALQSPEIFRDLGLPTLKKITRLAKEAGMPTMLHSCGPERKLVRICAEETDLDCINPLEPPPMGDCDLGELKRQFGDRLALMGNLHTTDVMLRGTPEEVERAARRCIEEAGQGGGFILSTGDQCGRDTPEANLFRLVETARLYGRY